MHIGMELSPDVQSFYNTLEMGLGVLGLLWASFKGVSWIRAIREKDLRGIKLDMTALNVDINRQTTSIETGFSTLETSLTRELQELRSDFRTFYTSPDPLMVPARARATRKRQSTAERANVKSKPKAKAVPKKTK